MSVLARDPDDKYRILDPDGNVVDGASVPDLDDETLVEMYRHMRLGRHFDERAVSLQRQGRLGTYPPLSGQEGSQVGTAYAMDEEDWLVPSYREHLAMVIRDVPLTNTLLYWRGYEAGNEIPDSANVFTVAVPIASQIPHATGLAWGAKLRGDDRAFVCHFGDGATSEGDFHEGLNFAGVFDTPTVFVCNNNQWAISVPRERQTASATLAQKAGAYGFTGVQVDGMDPLATYEVTRAAIEKARNPDDGQRRPTLIEAVQYRFGAHTTADDPSVYRDEEEVEQWRKRDPITRMEAFLRETGRLDDEAVAAIEDDVEEQVAAAVEAAEAESEPEPRAMFEHAYDEMPPRLQEQLAEFEALRERHDEEELLED
ncbi:MAG: pyruvate dehydrogenase (acetyl-transferring) E1 component subunit alpha [Halobacteriaceae archaeon]